MANSTILIYEDSGGWRFRVVSGHQGVVTSPTQYKSKASALSGARAFQRQVCEASIREIASRPGETASAPDTEIEEAAT